MTRARYHCRRGIRAVAAPRQVVRIVTGGPRSCDPGRTASARPSPAASPCQRIVVLTPFLLRSLTELSQAVCASSRARRSARPDCPAPTESLWCSVHQCGIEAAAWRRPYDPVLGPVPLRPPRLSATSGKPKTRAQRRSGDHVSRGLPQALHSMALEQPWSAAQRVDQCMPPPKGWERR